MGSPAELASRPDSQFRQMLDQAGISSVVEPQSLPPLARHDTDSDVTATPPPSRVKFDVRGDLTPTDSGSRAETPAHSSDDVVLIDGGDGEEKGYDNEVTIL